MAKINYVLGEVAPVGQITSFSGSLPAELSLVTTKLLIDSVVAKRIRATKTFYVGNIALVQKETLELHGIRAIVPPSDGTFMMNFLASKARQSGIVIVFDGWSELLEGYDEAARVRLRLLCRCVCDQGGAVIRLEHLPQSMAAA